MAEVYRKIQDIGGKTTFMKFEEGKPTKVRIVSKTFLCEKYKFEDGSQYGKKVFFKDSIPEGAKVKKAQDFYVMLIDRTDGQLKMFQGGTRFDQALEALRTNLRSGWEVTPPYDIVVTKKGKGSETQFLMSPDVEDTALTDEEQAMIEKAEPIPAYLKRQEEWEMREMGNADTVTIETAEGETLPF